MLTDMLRDGGGDEGDVPLLAAKRLDHERLVANKAVRDYLEEQGDRELHYSLQLPELLPGGITISRVIALTEHSFYKFSQSALTTANFHNARHAVVDLQHVLIKQDESDLHLDMAWSNRDVGVSRFTLRFREATQKRGFLLTLCNVLPDVAILYKDDNGDAAGAPVDPHAAILYGAPKAQPPLQLSPDAVDRTLGTPPRRPLLPKPTLPDLSDAPSDTNANLTGDITGDELRYMVHALCPEPGAASHMDSSITDPQESVLYVSPRHAKSDTRSLPRGPSGAGCTSTGSFQYDHLSALFEQAVVDEYSTLQAGDYVEVRDEPDEPWKDGWVSTITGDPLLVPLAENPNFFALANPATQPKVQPEGTDKSFFWRQLRVPREAELQLRQKEREEAVERARKAREDEEEKARIRKMILGMERRLEQELRDSATERLEAQQRVLSRQRCDDPRLTLAGYVPSPRPLSPLSATNRTPEAPSPFATGGCFGSPSPRVTVPTPFRFNKSRRGSSAAGGVLASPGQGLSAMAAESMSPSGAPCPDDRTLLGRDLYEQYTRWRHSGGLQEETEDWGAAESRKLLRGLKVLHGDLTRGGAPGLTVDRVARIMGMVDRERTMMANRQRSEVCDRSGPSAKPTVPVPFRLSAGSKPAILMNTQEVKSQLKDVAMASERAIDRMRQGYSQNGLRPPTLHSPSPQRSRSPTKTHAPPPSIVSGGERARQASGMSASARSSRKASGIDLMMGSPEQSVHSVNLNPPSEPPPHSAAASNPASAFASNPASASHPASSAQPVSNSLAELPPPAEAEGSAASHPAPSSQPPSGTQPSGAAGDEE
eukprot:TRINITY_DN27566_c0_g1_i1.p1 TRINITY_DN27566_c0_g1~~TRINITY_DN27566_c0_g1_i1.p1  ORF type:complete len:825 (+),score=210.54 TRINITY_DN27566_c0_g1_i1:39-2513(+)